LEHSTASTDLWPRPRLLPAAATRVVAMYIGAIQGLSVGAVPRYVLGGGCMLLLGELLRGWALLHKLPRLLV
jgi:hypothetical protein